MRKPTESCRTARSGLLALICLAVLVLLAAPLAAREREPNSVYAERRARLAAELKEPVLLFGYTGRENSSPAYVFLQEPNFYYLTGHNEEGAALLLVPASAAEKGWKGPNEILFLASAESRRGEVERPPHGSHRYGCSEKDRFFQRRSLLESKNAAHRIERKVTTRCGR